MSESLVEKIKQESKTLSQWNDIEIQIRNQDVFSNAMKIQKERQIKKVENAKFVLLVDVLKILEEQQQKLRELADAIKKRPTWEWMKDNLDKLEDIEFSFRQIEKKFVELGAESVKPTKKESKQ